MIKSLFILTVFLLFSFNLPDEFIIKPTRNYAISNVQIIKNLKENGLNTDYVYIPLEKQFWELGRITRKLNDCFLYDSNKRKCIFYDGIKCVYNTGLINNIQIGQVKYSEDSTHFKSIMSCIEPITDIQLKHNKYYAILLFNHALGVKREDNYIQWEQALKAKFSDSICIIKIQYDNNEVYSEGCGIKETFNQMYDYYIRQ